MIATFVFYLEEMMATLILFTVFFLLTSGAVLVVFVIDQAYRLAFEWAELQLKSLSRLGLRLHPCPFKGIESIVFWRPVYILSGLLKYVLIQGRGPQLCRRLRRTVWFMNKRKGPNLDQCKCMRGEEATDCQGSGV
jgi:hypothetical protein